jgi:hypothetical protein
MTFEPLRIDNLKVTPALPDAVFARNVAKTRERLLPGVETLPEWRAKPLAIVGGGPSLDDTLGELRRIKTVMVAGSAHDHLVSAGVWPQWCVVADPDPVMAQYLKKPSPRTRYLVASCCDGAVFDALDGYHVSVWHCFSKEHPEVWEKGDTLMLGGSTVGTRAIYLALSLGFRDLHLFGFDSCIREEDGKHHAYSFKTKEEDIGELRRIYLEDTSSKGYLCAGYMIAQIAEMVHIFKTFTDTVSFSVHGTGALADYAKWLQRKIDEKE